MTNFKAALARLLAVTTFVVFVFLAQPKEALAASSLSISPSTTTATQNTNKTFIVSINTDGAEVFGSDVLISYPVNAFEFVSATNGTFFTDFGYSVDQSTGTIALHGYFSSLYQTKSGSGSVASFVLKAKLGTGTATVPIVCSTSAQSSQIINNQGTNILSCGQVNQSTVTFSGGGSPTNTPTATPTNQHGASPTPTPTKPPGSPSSTPTPTQQGNREPSCISLSTNPSRGNKPLSVTLVCTGSDPNNDVDAVEFSLGNGQSVLVQRNVGQNGSLSTSFTYTNAGTYLVSCRVRDNNGRFSSTPTNCQKSIIVTTAGTTVPRSTSGAALSPTPTREPSPIVLTGSNPTNTNVISLDPLVSPSPTALAERSSYASASASWFSSERMFQIGRILLITIVTVLVGLIVRRLMVGKD